MEWVDNMRKRLDSLIESRGGVVPESSKGYANAAGDPIKFVSKDGVMRSGLLIVLVTVANFFS